MLYYDFIVGEETYKLRLSTRSIMTLEKKIGMNPLMIFGLNGDNIPTVSTMVQVLASSLEQFNHGIGEKEAQDIFDNWLSEGNTVTDFIQIIIEIYKVSGLIKNTEKN